MGSFDMQIRAGARAALQRELSRYFWGSGSDIKIVVKNGKIILLGRVATKADSDIANIQCNAVPNAFHVFNLLEGGTLGRQEKGVESLSLRSTKRFLIQSWMEENDVHEKSRCFRYPACARGVPSSFAFGWQRWQGVLKSHKPAGGVKDWCEEGRARQGVRLPAGLLEASKPNEKLGGDGSHSM
jgi:hypothetical protein